MRLPLAIAFVALGASSVTGASIVELNNEGRTLTGAKNEPLPGASSTSRHLQNGKAAKSRKSREGKAGKAKASKSVTTTTTTTTTTSTTPATTSGSTSTSTGSTSTTSSTSTGSTSTSTSSTSTSTSTTSSTTTTTTTTTTCQDMEVIADPPVPNSAPFCSTVGSSCTSGDFLEGVGNTELNQPNTIACPSAEVISGVGVIFQSTVQSITIESLNRCDLQAGGQARLTVDVTAFSPFTVSVRAYIATNAFIPDWMDLGGRTTSGDTNYRFSRVITLLDSPVQAVRVVFGFQPNEAACPSGQDEFVDRDDLIFTVAPGSSPIMENSPSVGDFQVISWSDSNVEDVVPATFDCALLTEGKCPKAANICQWSAKTESCIPKSDSVSGAVRWLPPT